MQCLTAVAATMVWAVLLSDPRGLVLGICTHMPVSEREETAQQDGALGSDRREVRKLLTALQGGSSLDSSV